MDNVDITGTMTKPIAGWEKRVEALCNTDNFVVGIAPTAAFIEGSHLTTSEMDRLLRKLALVRRYAQYMATGMLKGTLKYPTDSVSVDTWMAHLIGEGADQSNYAILLADAYHKRENYCGEDCACNHKN